jgi:hypothetical protein
MCFALYTHTYTPFCTIYAHIFVCVCVLFDRPVGERPAIYISHDARTPFCVICTHLLCGCIHCIVTIFCVCAHPTCPRPEASARCCIIYILYIYILCKINVHIICRPPPRRRGACRAANDSACTKCSQDIMHLHTVVLHTSREITYLIHKIS